MGQFLLQEMQELRNELSNYEHKIVSLVTPQTNKMNSSEVSSEQDKKDVIRQARIKILFLINCYLSSQIMH